MKTFLASLWDAVRKYLFSSTWVKDILFNYVSKLVLGSMGGFGFWIGSILLKKFVNWGWGQVEDIVIAEQVESRNEQKLEDYNEIIENPDSSAEAIRDAAPDFLGGDIK